jgi:beta-N-acetylhexosaminidase
MKRKIIFLWCLLTAIANIPAIADSLDIKIGQMILVGMQGSSVSNEDQIIRDVKKGIVGGILLYEYNLSQVDTKRKLKQLNERLHDAASIPLFISIDQEGGQVNRLKVKYGFPDMPSAKKVADRRNADYAKTIGERIANTLMECGINMNYAPVLDVHNPLCPVLGKRQRCYSTNTDTIAHYAGLLIESHHNVGIKTVVKHFPGHGNSLTDSHLGMADVSRYWKPDELKPYQSLINQGIVDAVMTAHIINRKLDSSGLPATLSKKIISGILRGELNYKGVVISDDMQMHAISSYYGFEESITKCINAGVDILMFSNNIKGAASYSPGNVHATIKKLVKEGKISEARIHESYQRIMSMKRSR